MKQHPEQPLNWYGLSYNPNITWDIVQQKPNEDWNWPILSQNPNITWDIVQQYPEKPWNWYMLSRNPNITWDIVYQNPDIKWDWSRLSSNPMNRIPSAIKIQKCFRRYISIKKKRREAYIKVMSELTYLPPNDLLKDGGLSYQQALIAFVASQQKN